MYQYILQMNPFIVASSRVWNSSLRRNNQCRTQVACALSLRSNITASAPLCSPSDRQATFRMYQTTARTLSEAAPSVSAPTKASDEMPPILWTTHRLNAASIQKVERIFHKILWLDMFESCMLNDIINHQMGIVLTPRQRKQLAQVLEDRAAGGRSAAVAEEAAPEETGPVLVDLQLAQFDAAAKIKVIKEVRSILGLGLKEAKELVESAPVMLQKGLKPEAAEEMKAKLEAAGATVALS